MKTTTQDLALQRTLLSVFLVLLLVIAGCSGTFSDSENEEKTTPTVTPVNGSSESLSALKSANHTDLRNLTIPDEGSTTVHGELDGDDPVSGNTVYEPVQFPAAAGTVVNITTRTDQGELILRLIDPNGTTIDTTSNEGSDTAQFTRLTLSERGNYTIKVASFSPNTTLKYTLAIERDDRLFSGPMSAWNETEQYLEFGQDFARAANVTADNGQFSTVVGEQTLSANAEKDYMIIGYQWDAENLTTKKMLDIDVAIQLTYANLDETYQNATANSDVAENESWVPEVIYFRTENPEGELYRTHFVTQEWAQDYARTGNGNVYDDRYFSTNRIGPGSPSYEPGGKIMTTESEFPLETYRNYTYPDGTTHAERYYD